MKTKLHKRVVEQGKLISKISGRGKMVKFNKKRISIYEKGKYKGWTSRKDYTSLKRDSDITLKYSKPAERFKVNFKKTSFLKPVTVKTGKMKKAVRKELKIITYTKTQRKFVYKEFKKHKIPMRKKSTFQKIVDLRKTFKMLGIKMSKLKRPSP